MATQTIEIRAVDKTQTALRNIERNTNRLQQSFGGVTRAAGAFIAALGVREVIKFGTAVKDATAEFQRQTNQLRLITNSQQELTATTNMLRQAAIDNRTAFGDTVDLYTKLTLATEDLGKSSEEVLAVTGKLSQALAVSGADAATTSSVIRQFGQAMASGTVRGDEFNSLVEGLGPALSIMARESGVTVGQLRQMSRNGELTADAFFQMLQNAEGLTAAFNQMQPTLDNLETAFGDAFDAALIQLGEVTGFTQAYENALISATRALRQFSGTQTELEKISLDELLGTDKFTATQKLEEFLLRTDDVADELRDIEVINNSLWGGLPGQLSASQRQLANYLNELGITLEQYHQMKTALEEAAEAERLRNEEIARNAELERQRAEELENALRPFKESIDLARSYIRSGYGSALDKNNQSIARVRQALEDMNAQTVISQLGTEEVTRLTAALTLELAYLEEQNKKLVAAQNELTQSGDAYASFLENVIETMNKSVQTDQFKQRAITEISARYRDGTYTLEQYEAAMQQLDSTFETTNERQQRETDQLITKQEALRDQVENLAESYKTYFMDRIQQAEYATEKEIQTLKDAYVQGAIDLDTFNQHKLNAELVLQDRIKQIRDKAAEEELRRQEAIINKNLQAFKAGKFGEVDVSELTEDQKKEYALKSGREALDQLGKYNKTAFQAAKALNIAEAVMNTYTGATKALASFPPPFNFIAAAAVVAAGLANVATIRAQTYTGRQRGGDLRSGQLAMVGEDGPEMIVPKRPSTVIPREVAQAIEGMGGNGGPVTVNFNINTVDARGFDELLIERRGTITGIINNAMQQRGRVGVV